MLQLIEDSLARMLDDAANASSSPLDLIESLELAGMLDLLVAADGDEAPLGWPDAARLFMLLGAKAPNAPVADAILARAALGGSAAERPAFTVLATRAATVSFGGSADQPTVTGTVEGVPWGQVAEAVVAVVGAPVAEAGAVGAAATPTSSTAPMIVVLARSAADRIRASGTGVEPRAAWVFDAAQPLDVLPCPTGLDPLLAASAMRAAQIAGAMAAARELTLRYASDRVQFGKPIGRQQAVQHRIAVMAEHSALVGAAALLAFADDGPPSSRERVASAKGLASEYANEVAAAAHAVHGAIGFTEEYELSRLTRRLWQWRSEHGGASAHYEAIGLRVLADPEPGVWQRVVETTRLAPRG